jgi:hypothetical protein
MLMHGKVPPDPDVAEEPNDSLQLYSTDPVPEIMKSRENLSVSLLLVRVHLPWQAELLRSGAKVNSRVTTSANTGVRKHCNHASSVYL